MPTKHSHMQYRIAFLVLVCWIAATTGAQAQKNYYYKQPAKFFSKAITFSLGSQGVGVDLRLPFSEPAGVHFGASILPFSMPVNTSMGKYKVRSVMSAEMYNVHLVLDWAPFPHTESIMRKFTGSFGAAYFFKARTKVESKLRENYVYGEIVVSKEDVGTMRTEVTFKNMLAPYFSAGFQNIYVGEYTSFGLSAGAYYMSGAPQVNMSGTNLLEGNEVNAPVVERNMSSYRWWPVLQVNFNYEF